MPRHPQSTRERTVYECVEPFAIFINGVPRLYNADRTSRVAEGDAILKTHRSHFRPVSERVEQMTAAPGEFRPVDIPIPPEAQPASEAESTDLEPENKEADNG